MQPIRLVPKEVPENICCVICCEFYKYWDELVDMF